VAWRQNPATWKKSAVSCLATDEPCSIRARDALKTFDHLNNRRSEAWHSKVWACADDSTIDFGGTNQKPDCRSRGSKPVVQIIRHRQHCFLILASRSDPWFHLNLVS
jgi:hypothetical protein